MRLSDEEREKKVAEVIRHIKNELGSNPFICLMKLDDNTTNAFGACTEEERVDLITSIIGQLIRDKGAQKLMEMITNSFLRKGLLDDDDMETLGMSKSEEDGEEKEFSDHVRLSNRKNSGGLLDYVRDRLRKKSEE